MDVVKFFLDISYGDYSSKNASNLRMTILGDFLSSDVGCGLSSRMKPTWQDWVLDDSLGTEVGSNLTFLEKDNEDILLSDLFSDEEPPTQLKMTRDQLVKLLNDWQEIVCKLKPKEVILKYENDQYVFETKD